MKDTQKGKPRVKKIEEEILSLKASQGVPLHEGCHNWRGRWIRRGRSWMR